MLPTKWLPQLEHLLDENAKPVNDTSEAFNSPDELPSDQSWGCLLSAHRAYEFCLAALWDDKIFVFYIWDED